MRYRPTLSEFLHHWNPSSDDPLTLVLFGAYVTAIAITALIA